MRIERQLADAGRMLFVVTHDASAEINACHPRAGTPGRGGNGQRAGKGRRAARPAETGRGPAAGRAGTGDPTRRAEGPTARRVRLLWRCIAHGQRAKDRPKPTLQAGKKRGPAAGRAGTGDPTRRAKGPSARRARPL